MARGHQGRISDCDAIAVLRSFTADEPLLGVTEIANRVGLHKGTVSRILATFEQENLVERDEDTRRFRLGLGLIAVASPLLAELEEHRVAYPVLSESICVEQIARRHHTPPRWGRVTTTR